MLRQVLVSLASILCTFAQPFALEGDWDTQIDLPGQQARLVIHVTKTGQSYSGTFDNPEAGVSERPIRDVVLEGNTVKLEIVPAKGKFIGTFSPDGLSITGKVGMPVGEFAMRMQRATPVPTEPADEPRALAPRGLQNIEAFARLLGYIRHFHPSDGVRGTDWNEFAVYYASRLESARNAAELSSGLNAAFSPVAPGLLVWPTGTGKPEGVAVRGKEWLHWRHHGFAENGTAGIYRSELVREGESAQKVSAIRRSLPGGVEVSIPVQVPSDGSVTLPRSTGWKPSKEVKRSGNTRATRLGSVIILWNVVQHFYPYFDVVGADWNSVLPRALERAAVDRDQLQFLGTLRWMAVEMKDGHGSVRVPAEPQRFTPDVLWAVIDGKLVVSYAGADVAMKPGDVVLSLGGRPAMEMLKQAEAISTGATPQLIRYRALRLLGSGDKGTVLKVEIEPYDQAGARRTVELLCETPSAQRREKRPFKLGELKPGIWYVDWSRISNEDFEQNLQKLADAKGIVFDLRGYPSFQDPVKIFQHLLPEGGTSAQWHVPVIEQPDRESMTFEQSKWQIAAREPLLTAKKVFLTDGRAISYAESCMGIVEHYKLGEIVGESTAGTNGNVISLRLPGNYTFAWTGMKVLKHDGSRHHGVGILATVPVSRTREGIAAGKDEVLERGISLLGDPVRSR